MPLPHVGAAIAGNCKVVAYINFMLRRTFLATLSTMPTVVVALASASAQVPGPPAQMTPRLAASVREVHDRVKAKDMILVDIRTPEEWRDTGVAEGAIRLDMLSPAFEARLAAIRAENPGKPIAIICRTANRTRRVQEALTRRGWQGIIDVRGGMLGDGLNKGWLDEGLPVGK